MRKTVFAAGLIALTVAVAPACATKKFVRTEVGNVNSKVDTLTGTVEETQERTRQNAERIGAVDQKAEMAAKSATDARSAADAANTRAEAANARANEVSKEVNTRVDEVVASSRRLVYEVTLSEDQGNFRFGRTELPDEAKSRLDSLVGQLKSDPKGIYIEIEGHTDNVGSKELNDRLGLERAETVKRYLYEQHQVPLHKINVISYGEDKPVAPNRTRQGRSQNRRVVVRILS
jgi:outer membrane protein OmpA-like peptidoglycan-associated protein